MDELQRNMQNDQLSRRVSLRPDREELLKRGILQGKLAVT